MRTGKNIFKITHNNLFPSQGNILISEPSLQDLYFLRAVILLVEHTHKGSMGFVLNKKTNLYVNEFFPELEQENQLPIYLGGPVDADHLFFIHSLGDTIIPHARAIDENLFLGGDFEALKRYIMSGHSIEGKVKFFLGYSGWSAGQLGREIKGESWIVSTSHNESILSAVDEHYWKASLARLGQRYRSWINLPIDPQLN